MENHDLVTIPSEDFEVLREGGVRERLDPTQFVALGFLENPLKLPALLREIAQVLMALLLIGEGEHDEGHVGRVEASPGEATRGDRGDLPTLSCSRKTKRCAHDDPTRTSRP
jgi:hypothetical protein